MEPPVLRGLELRSLLVLVLLDAGRPMTLAALTSAVERRGFAFGGRASKEAGDALRWEVARGRVVRTGRGVYAAGTVAKVTKHRMRARVAATRHRAA
jgi:hypothetical protein